MPALQVRDFPDALYDALKESAARNHRSIAQQTTAFIEEGLGREASYTNVDEGLSTANAAELAALSTAVREASARTRFVDPFDWAAAYEAESSATAEERKRRRAKAKQMISRVNTSTGQSFEDVAALVRSIRENRLDSVSNHASKAPAKAGM